MSNKKIALITGATRGIGLAITKDMSKHGYIVLGTGTSENSVNYLKNELELNKIEGKAYLLDIKDQESINNLFKNISEDYSDTPDVLINNAGITKDNLLMRMSENDFDSVIEINLKSVFNMTKAVQKIFLKKRSGSIINMSSIVGIKGNAGQSNYAASKSGIIGFSKSIAIELGSRNIRCNVIAPGFIKTEMTDNLSASVIESWNSTIPLKRPGETHDVANLCLFLASDLSSYITGQVINVDGGLLT